MQCVLRARTGRLQARQELGVQLSSPPINGSNPSCVVHLTPLPRVQGFPTSNGQKQPRDLSQQLSASLSTLSRSILHFPVPYIFLAAVFLLDLVSLLPRPALALRLRSLLIIVTIYTISQVRCPYARPQRDIVATTTGRASGLLALNLGPADLSFTPVPSWQRSVDGVKVEL